MLGLMWCKGLWYPRRRVMHHTCCGEVTWAAFEVAMLLSAAFRRHVELGTRPTSGLSLYVLDAQVPLDSSLAGSMSDHIDHPACHWRAGEETGRKIRFQQGVPSLQGVHSGACARVSTVRGGRRARRARSRANTARITLACPVKISK